MYWKRKNKAARAQIDAALEDASYDIVKVLAKKLGLKPKSRKKTDAVAEIIPYLQDATKAAKIFLSLDSLQQKAVAEAVFHQNNEYDDGRFAAKYGNAPKFKIKLGQYESEPTLLRLFIYSDDYGEFIPQDLAAKIKPFVPQPQGFFLKTVNELPENITIKFPDWQRKTAEEIPLNVRETENEALQDFWSVLRLVEEKKIAVSDKTFYPSAKSIEEIAAVLRDGDFYEIKEDKQYYPQIGAIKGFAWAMILQASKLTNVSAKKLALSNQGRKILNKPAHEIIKNLWQSWQKTTILDEFNRVDEIKGQKRKGRTNLTGIKPRRESVADSFQLCPVGEWISIDEFFRCVRLNFDFTVARDEWNLYISEHGYGSLGYEYGVNFDKWYVLEARYILAVLFEYCATLGLIDVAYIPPFGARRDYGELWGTDDLDFLSRYDGLKFIRINNLGAFCLDLAENYELPKIAVKSSFTILPNLTIKTAGGNLTAGEELFLENFAKKESESVWRLSRELAINALENGQQISALREFLESREDQLLPETVEGFLRDTEKRAVALTDKGTARIVECETTKIADEIAENRHTKKLCQRVGNKSLAIFEADEKKFREIVRKIGYGLKYK
ncbi:hypothetical protein BH20ACI1_BH20ACI1_11370 [soil metagenome]